MSKLEPGTSPVCPWCGAPAKKVTDVKGRINWMCGSWQHGTEPWRSENCEINTLSCTIDILKQLLTAIVEDAEYRIPNGAAFDVRAYSIREKYLERAKKLLK